ncbi:MAG: hypothetical protein KIH08_14960 [Candidatus Freyarchaeota archaeon]|nr:hypothetical protein [Candidatus Jordarchaeia archaeon]
MISTCDKSELFKYIEERKVLVSKIENSAQCEMDSLLHDIERFHSLSNMINSYSRDCLNSRLITRKDYYRIRNETNEMYTLMKRIVNKNLEKCKIDGYII